MGVVLFDVDFIVGWEMCSGQDGSFNDIYTLRYVHTDKAITDDFVVNDSNGMYKLITAMYLFVFFFKQKTSYEI